MACLQIGRGEEVRNELFLRTLFVREHYHAESAHPPCFRSPNPPSAQCVISISYVCMGVWHGRCQHQRQESLVGLQDSKSKRETSGACMFDGKNNRLLDSFAFRLALGAAVFVAWAGGGYILLSLA